MMEDQVKITGDVTRALEKMELNLKDQRKMNNDVVQVLREMQLNMDHQHVYVNQRVALGRSCTSFAITISLNIFVILRTFTLMLMI
jgi:hypothetical protein